MEYMLMPLKRYADFSGRSRRMEFWMWQLFKFLVGLVMMVLIFTMGGAGLFSGDPAVVAQAITGMFAIWGLFSIFGLAILIPDIAVTVRRLHDTNRTGWWILAPIVPYIIGTIAALTAASSGTDGGMAAGGIIGLIAMLAAFVFAITLLVFYFLEGTHGPNKYGSDPKRPDSEVFA